MPHRDQVLEESKGKIDFGSTEHINFNLYMSFWYGELYVVIEGWRVLKLSDPQIDSLLANETMVAYLKRYRNGAFHFQKDYFDDRFVDLFSQKDSAVWIRSLTQEFSRYFLEYYQLKKKSTP